MLQVRQELDDFYHERASGGKANVPTHLHASDRDVASSHPPKQFRVGDHGQAGRGSTGKTETRVKDDLHAFVHGSGNNAAVLQLRPKNEFVNSFDASFWTRLG